MQPDRSALPRFLLFSCVLWSVFVGISVVRGQNRDPSSASDSLEAPAGSPADLLRAVQDELSAVGERLQSADLSDDERSSLETRLGGIRGQIDRAAEARHQTAALQEQMKQLRDTVRKLQQDSDRAPLPDLSSLDIPELETRIAELRIQITTAEQELAAAAEQRDRVAETRRQWQEQLRRLEQKVSETADSPKETPAAASPAEQIDRLESIADHLRAVAERDLIQTQLADLEARQSLNLPDLTVDRIQQQIRTLRQQLQVLHEELERRQQQASQEQLRQARLSESDLRKTSDARIRELGRLRLKLAEDNERLTRDIARWRDILTQRSEQLQRLQNRSQRIRTRVTRFGTGRTVGRELLNFGNSLPSPADLRARIAELDELTLALQMQYSEYEESEEIWRDVAARTSPEPGSVEEEILSSLPVLLREYQKNNRQLESVLGDVNGVELETADFVREWNSFVQEQALWLRSHPPLKIRDGRLIVSDLKTLLQDLDRGLREGGPLQTRTVWFIVVPALLAVALLLAVQAGARQRLLHQGTLARAGTCIRMQPTWWALLLSVGLAAEWPLVLLFVGSTLNTYPHPVVRAFGRTLMELGAVALWLDFFRQVLRPGGLAHDHLAWNPFLCTRLRRWLRLVILVMGAPLFLFLLARHLPDVSDSTERFLFIFLQICSTVLLVRLLYPLSGPFVSTISATSPFLKRTRAVWTAFLVAAPVALAVCSAAGFHHTAISLWVRLGWSLVIGSGVLLVWSLVERALQISHRVMRLKQARERARQRDGTADGDSAPLLEPVVLDENDFQVHRRQARLLVRNVAVLLAIGCLWAIWSDVLPALRGVTDRPLWYVEEQNVVESDTPESDDRWTVRVDKRPVTVGSLLLVGFVTVAAWIGVRQLPGLLEVILQRRTSLTSGLRYTITTVVRYAVLTAGVMICSHLLGLRWSQVQWLVAGLSVGLGFGLQEVFANFVSGIIILVERPIRIGDVVTIDGISGVVSRIQIRATSITDWDRREYIVPNRELVTGKLLNWTLSDTTNRIVLSVGIGYACDPDQARRIMLDIAAQHPNVMDDPAPIATFENFGDSSLDLVLRAWLPDLNNRLSTITELHTQILQAFNEQGITIPFPQREVTLIQPPD